MQISKEVIKHREFYKYQSVDDMPMNKYKQLLEQEAFLFFNSERHLAGAIFGEVIATNKDQIEELIRWLEVKKGSMFE